MGMIFAGLLTTRFTVIASPLKFVREPWIWLEWLTEFKVTCTAGPNFAFDLVCAKTSERVRARINLSSVRIFLNGAEPVRAKTVRRFISEFSPCGLRASAMSPVYGMAESTLTITSVAPPVVIVCLDAEEYAAGDVVPLSQSVVGEGEGEKGGKNEKNGGRRTVEIVACGYPAAMQIAIVDMQTCEVLPPRRVGEIWVRGERVAKGYFGNQEATEATFGAVVRNVPSLSEQKWLRTGDLEFLLDGRLYVSGRHKVFIIKRRENETEERKKKRKS